jgi:hypothetical protein
MLSPFICREWHWDEYDMHHAPGITTGCVKELVEKGGANEMILSTGMNEMLGVSPETYEYLLSKRVPYAVYSSQEAVDKYNERVQGGARIGMLLHSTC